MSSPGFCACKLSDDGHAEVCLNRNAASCCGVFVRMWCLRLREIRPAAARLFRSTAGSATMSIQNYLRVVTQA